MKQCIKRRSRAIGQTLGIVTSCLWAVSCGDVSQTLLESLSTGATEPEPPAPEITEPEPPAPEPLPSEFDDPAGIGPETNLVFNGHFEFGLEGWDQTVEPNAASGESAHGEQAAKLEFGGELRQEIRVLPNSDYELSLMVKVDPEPGEPEASGTVLIGDVAVDVPFPTEQDVYLPAALSFNSGSADSVVLVFAGGFMRIDDVLLEGPRPEPLEPAGDAGTDAG